MQPARASASNIHPRPFSYRVQSFKYLQVTIIINGKSQQSINSNKIPMNYMKLEQRNQCSNIYTVSISNLQSNKFHQIVYNLYNMIQNLQD